MSDQPVARPVPTQDDTTNTKDKHPCPERDSNRDPVYERLRPHGHRIGPELFAVCLWVKQRFVP
jgi:hypothetical protein